MEYRRHSIRIAERLVPVFGVRVQSQRVGDLPVTDAGRPTSMNRSGDDEVLADIFGDIAGVLKPVSRCFGVSDGELCDAEIEEKSALAESIALAAQKGECPFPFDDSVVESTEMMKEKGTLRDDATQPTRVSLRLGEIELREGASRVAPLDKCCSEAGSDLHDEIGSTCHTRPADAVGQVLHGDGQVTELVRGTTKRPGGHNPGLRTERYRREQLRCQLAGLGWIGLHEVECPCRLSGFVEVEHTHIRPHC